MDEEMMRTRLDQLDSIRSVTFRYKVEMDNASKGSSASSNDLSAAPSG